MAQRTADEVKASFVAAFPSGTGELAHELWKAVNNLHFKWENYRSLFGTSPDRIDLLNWAAPSFFGLLDGILRSDVMLAIARLTDPPKSMGRDNACLARLIETLVPFTDTQSVDSWRAELQDLQTYCEPVRVTRNRLLAHEDLATALHYHPDPIPGVSRPYIDGALERFRKLFGSIEVRFRGSQTAFQLVSAVGDGESVISRLEDAQEHEKCRERDFDEEYGIDANDT